MSKFFEVVDGLIALSHENRNKFNSQDFGMANYVMELCTIKVACGRRVGKTRYILERARPWDVVVVANRALRDQGFRQCKAEVFTFDELLSNIWGFRRGMPQLKPRTIYVDEGGLLSPDQLHTIWRHFISHPDQTMVVLG